LFHTLLKNQPHYSKKLSYKLSLLKAILSIILTFELLYFITLISIQLNDNIHIINYQCCIVDTIKAAYNLTSLVSTLKYLISIPKYSILVIKALGNQEKSIQELIEPQKL
jgi:hypothetical protein